MYFSRGPRISDSITNKLKQISFIIEKDKLQNMKLPHNIVFVMLNCRHNSRKNKFRPKGIGAPFRTHDEFRKDFCAAHPRITKIFRIERLHFATLSCPTAETECGLETYQDVEDEYYLDLEQVVRDASCHDPGRH